MFVSSRLIITRLHSACKTFALQKHNIDTSVLQYLLISALYLSSLRVPEARRSRHVEHLSVALKSPPCFLRRQALQTWGSSVMYCGHMNRTAHFMSRRFLFCNPYICLRKCPGRGIMGYMPTRINLLAAATHYSKNWEVDMYYIYVMMLRKGEIEGMGKDPKDLSWGTMTWDNGLERSNHCRSRDVLRSRAGLIREIHQPNHVAEAYGRVVAGTKSFACLGRPG
ncbi:hypothetical protein BDV36DRAFT_51077 [Aspergillus pseudocaelatus]|uniref:Uncharacterized protein n=1 Tax=Aspergillus pseudocaelatus TaxID=1825620 RepID=A0ABQ6W6J2_9EURO|nr:hypothetical protein BDV36DRAFT_51077 [Aspergillus pseudocaelatus]